MKCPDCHAEILDWYERHLKTCAPHQARMLGGGAMVHTPGKTPINPTGKRKTKCDAPGCSAPALPLILSCAKHAPKHARRADGMCQKCGDYPREGRRTYCTDCKNKMQRANYHKNKAAK